MGRKTPKTPEIAEPIADEQPEPIDARALLLVCLLLVLAIAAVFVQVRAQRFVNYEDNLYITDNAVVQKGLTSENVRAAFTAGQASNWHPLTTITHLADVQLFGMNAGAHKLINVALHAGATIFLLLFLVRTTGNLWAAAIVAALFALHPTRVEAVAWVTARKEVLSGFFAMLTLWLYAGYVRERTPARMVMVALAFACAALSKATIVALPFAMLLLDYWPFRRIAGADVNNFDRLKPLLIEKLPLFAPIYPVVVMSMRVDSEARSIAFGTRVANAMLSYVEYLRMLVWPSGLAVFYPSRTAIDALAAILAAVVLVAITFTAIRYARRAPFAAAGWLWFLVMLVPVVSRPAVADRYTYLPYIGLFLAVVWTLQRALATRPFVLKAAAACAVVAIFAGVAFAQTGYWKNSETLFARTVNVTSKNALAHINLGVALTERGDHREAAGHFREAIAIDDDNALAYNGLGTALRAIGDLEGAEAAFRKAISIDPTLTPAVRRLGEIQLATGRGSEAVPLLQKVAGENNPQAAAELAAARGDMNEAVKKYAEALVLAPTDAELRNNYAAVLARSNNDAEALKQYEEAIRLKPDHYDARMNIAALLSRMNRNDEAARHLVAASALRPTSPEPNVYLALVYANQKKYNEAIQQIDAALARDAETANRLFSTAVRMQYSEQNLEQYKVFLQGRIGG
jgi:protein O-mannosyl-transferase